MIYRVVNEQRMPQVEELWDYCFEKREEPFFQYYFQNYCGKDNMVIGGFEKTGEGAQEKLRAMLHVNPYMLRLRGREQLVPYLVGVATAPEARGRHALAELLQTAFEVLRSEHFAFVTLMPLYAGIYAPYGFAYCYERLRYAMPLAALKNNLAKNFSGSLRAERVPLRQEMLAPLYEKLAGAYNAVPLRTDFQWRKLLAVHALEKMQCALIYREGTPCGYMLYYIDADRFVIHELLADAADAHARLLAYAAAHESAAKKFSWLAPPWDRTYLQFADQQLAPQLAPFMMARCLDARQALADLKISEDVPDASVVLLLTDKLIDRNNHLLRLESEGGKLNSKSTIEEEEVTLDMAAFAQLYFGAYSASELWEAGRLRVRADRSAKIRFLDQLFPKTRNFNNEYF